MKTKPDIGDTAMKKAIGYTRVSGAEQCKGQSLTEQAAKIAAWCRARGIELAGIVEDGGVTGSKEIRERPGVRDILDRAAAGEFDAVIVLRLDRFSRNLYEALWCEKRLLTHGVEVVSIEQDTSGMPEEMAKAFRSIMLTFAELDKDMSVKKMSAGRAAKFAVNPVGPSAGRISYGYTTSGARGAKALVPVPEEQAGLRRMRTMAARGFGYERIAQALNGEVTFYGQDMAQSARGGGQWSGAMVRRAMNSGHGQGRVAYQGKSKKVTK